MEFQDNSGAIRAVAFNNDCQKFNALLEEDKIYGLSKACVIPSYTKTPNYGKWELKLTNMTKVRSNNST